MNREQTNERISLDLVIPVFNEESVIPILLERLGQVFSGKALHDLMLRDVRVVFVDDGSTDRTVDVITSSGLQPYGITVVSFSRNFGHQAAVTAGLSHTVADVVVVMDADLQDPPECIPKMLEGWREGYDVVYGIRRKRKENLLKVFSYWIFYRVYRWLSPINVPADSGDFCLMSRRVVDELEKLPEAVRFPRGLRSWVGFRQTGIEYERPPRAAGESKYDLKRLYELATDGIISLSIRPLQFTQFVAFLYLVFTLITLIIIIAFTISGSIKHAGLWGVLFVTLLSNSVVLLCLHILGAYVGRTYFEVKGRPVYIVREIMEKH